MGQLQADYLDDCNICDRKNSSTQMTLAEAPTLLMGAFSVGATSMTIINVYLLKNSKKFLKKS